MEKWLVDSGNRVIQDYVDHDRSRFRGNSIFKVNTFTFPGF